MTDAAAAKPAKLEKKQGFVAETVEIIKTVFYALLIALVLRVVLFQPFTIPSASEEPNLYRGDYIIVSKWSYGWSQKSVPFLDNMATFAPGRLFFSPPKRGDIIVFKDPPTGQDYIKRLIGLPGDQVQMRSGQLYINGKPLSEQATPLAPLPRGLVDEYVPQDGLEPDWGPRKGQIETNPEGRSYLTQVFPVKESRPDDENPANTGVFIVPAHCYFMMGDNRDDSADSRFNPGPLLDGDPKLGGCGVSPSVLQDEGVGFVPEANLVGKAWLVLISWNTGSDRTPCCANIFEPWTWFDVRWNRMFKLLH